MPGRVSSVRQLARPIVERLGQRPIERALSAGSNCWSDGGKVPTLTLKWAFGFPGATTASSQPTVVGGRVIVGSEAGGVYALDLAKGCLHWKFDTEGGVRTAIAIGSLGGNPVRPAAFFGDLKAFVYAVDAQTGELIWKLRADEHPFTRITGAPTSVPITTSGARRFWHR